MIINREAEERPVASRRGKRGRVHIGKLIHLIIVSPSVVSHMHAIIAVGPRTDLAAPRRSMKCRLAVLNGRRAPRCRNRNNNYFGAKQHRETNRWAASRIDRELLPFTDPRHMLQYCS